MKAGQFAGLDAFPEDFTKIILQDFESHGRSIALTNRGGDGGNLRRRKRKDISTAKGQGDSRKVIWGKNCFDVSRVPAVENPEGTSFPQAKLGYPTGSVLTLRC
jgi:hypothetical protein